MLQMDWLRLQQNLKYGKKIVEAESGINVGVESKKQSELELERLLSDKQAAKNRIATAGWSKKIFHQVNLKLMI